jgi:hypothetical protein
MQHPSRATFPIHGISFVALDDHAFAAERAIVAVTGHHGFADAMPDEPASFEIDAQGAAELVSTETLLAAAHQVHRLQPDVHRHMAFLEDGADFDGERLAAGIALVGTDPGALALQRAALVHNAAMRADAPGGPHNSLDVGIGGLLVAEAGFVKNGLGHDISPCEDLYNA